MDFKHIRLSDIEPGLVYRALCESYRGWSEYQQYENDWKQYDKDIHDYPDSVGNSGFGTILGNEFAGFISWDPRQYPANVTIGHNCVLPEFRNRGIGKHQLSEALNQLKSMGFHQARVSTKRCEFFMHARRMYASSGFMECAPYRDDGENMIYYSQELSGH